MDKFYLGTNWKMHKTAAEAEDYIGQVDRFARDYPEYTFFMIPPYTALWQMRSYIRQNKAPFLLGAQNAHYEPEGAYTGEISLPMLQEIGMDLIEIGHSERRQYAVETDEDVRRKTDTVIKNGLTALICVGENAGEKLVDASCEKVRLQLRMALFGVSEEYSSKVWVAYEPVWSIGEGGTPADSAHVHKVHAEIRNLLCQLWPFQGKHVPILYGGSVNPENCAEYVHDENVNGLFIGRSAWQPDSFHVIMETVRKARAKIERGI